MFAIPACPSCRFRCVIPCLMLLITALGLVGCTSNGSSHEQVQMIPSSRGFVLPGDEARAVQLMAGLAEPGSDFGPFFGRSDGKMALNPAAGEKFEDQYDRRILDRQFTSLGRPFNVYQDTTRSISRVSR